MPQRTSSGYKAGPLDVARRHEDLYMPGQDTQVNCPTCTYPGFIGAIDDRGVLVQHPGRRWPCRVAPGTEA